MNTPDLPTSMDFFMQRVDHAVQEATPPSRVELARLLVLLFTAMRSCHMAYLQWEKSKIDKTFTHVNNDTFPYSDSDFLEGERRLVWEQSVSALQSVVSSLSAPLHIIAPDIFHEVASYMSDEAMAAFGENPLENLIEINYYAATNKVEFKDTLNRLGQFIRDKFSMEEILQASTETSF